MVRGSVWCAAFALVAMMFVAPAASGDHCQTKINVYGRVALAPLPPPPYLSATAGMCVSVFGALGAEEHSLPPNTGEVMVRVHGDYGHSVPSVRVVLDGLGFVEQEFRAYRTLNQAGPISYEFAGWVPLPNGPMDGALNATVITPWNSVSTVTYHTTLTVEPPSVELP